MTIEFRALVAKAGLGISLLFGCVATSASATDDPNIHPSMRQDDRRLDARITVYRRRIVIGELLEELERQTGVKLSAGERDGVADPAVAVFCHDLPLHTLLNSLWSLMSYRNALWQWDRKGDRGAYRYELTAPRRAQKLRERLLNWTQEQFERNAERLLAAVDGSDEDRRQVLKQIYGDPEINDATLSPDRLWADLRAFKHAITPEQQRSVLRGGGPIEAPLGALDEKTRDYLLGAWRELNGDTWVTDGNGIKHDLPEPTGVRFERTRYVSTPSLCVNMVSMSTAAPHEIGGVPLENAFRAYLRSLWLLPTDQKEDPALDVLMTKPADLRKAPTLEAPTGVSSGQPQLVDENSLDQLGRILEMAATGAKVSLLARLPEDDPWTSMAEPWNQTLRDYWHRLRRQPLMVKWRDGVHLVSTQVWPIEDPPVPLFVVLQLRKHARPGELLPFDQLVQAAGLLTVGQLNRLVTEFPVMRLVAQVREILALFYREPALARRAQSMQGLPLTGEVARLLQPFLPPALWEKVESGEAQFLIVKIVQQTNPRIPPRDVIFQLRDRMGKFIAGYGFRDEPQPVPPTRK